MIYVFSCGHVRVYVRVHVRGGRGQDRDRDRGHGHGRGHDVRESESARVCLSYLSSPSFPFYLSVEIKMSSKVNSDKVTFLCSFSSCSS